MKSMKVSEAQSESECSLKEKVKQLTKQCEEKISLKLEQAVFNIINERSSSIYFHLFIPHAGKFMSENDTEVVGVKIKNYKMWKNTSYRVSDTNTIRFQVKIKPFEFASFS